IGLAVSASRPSTIYAIVEVAPVLVKVDEGILDRVRALLDNSTAPDARTLGALRADLERAMPSGSGATFTLPGLSRSEAAQLRVALGFDALDTGGGVFRSDDAGRTWRRTNPLNEREGYYSQIRIDPTDPEHIYALLVRVSQSRDGGQAFEQTRWAL